MANQMESDANNDDEKKLAFPLCDYISTKNNVLK